MIIASKISNIFKDAVDKSCTTFGNKDRVKRLKASVIKEMKEKLRYSDVVLSKDVDKVSEDIDINIVADELQDLGDLYMISQMTCRNLNKTLTVVYSNKENALLYTFGEEIYTVDRNSINKLVTNEKPSNIFATVGTVNKQLRDYTRRDCNNAKHVCDSIGSAIVSVILGELDGVYYYGFNESNYVELLRMCDVYEIQRTCFNGVYKFSRITSKSQEIKLEDTFIYDINGHEYECIKLCGDKYAILNKPKTFKDYNIVYPIIAIKNFADIKIGTIGGYISLDTTINLTDRSWIDGGSIAVKSHISNNSSVEGSKVILINSDISYCGLNNKSAKYSIVIEDSSLHDCDLVGKFAIKDSNLRKVTRLDEDDEITEITHANMCMVQMEPAIIKLRNVYLDNVIIADDTCISNIKLDCKARAKLACSSMKVNDLDFMVTISVTDSKITKIDIDKAVETARSKRESEKMADSAMHIIEQINYFDK